MRLKPEELDRESFRKLGDFENLLEYGNVYSGKRVDEGFFPDALRLDNDGRAASVSVTRVCGKKTTICNVEVHSNTCEAILPLDGDVYIFAAPAFWYLKLDETRLFRVPKGTMVKLKPGVIHGSPISADGSPVNVLILLPERTYSNDCKFIELEKEKVMVLDLD